MTGEPYGYGYYVDGGEDETGWWVVLLLLGAVVLFVVLVWGPAGTAVAAARASGWPQVEAHVDDYHERRVSSDGEAYYTVERCTLSYRVDGHACRWTGDPHQRSGAVTTGGTLAVRYDPADPANIFIRPSTWPVLELSVAGGCAVVIVGVFVLRPTRQRLRAFWDDVRRW